MSEPSEKVRALWRLLGSCALADDEESGLAHIQALLDSETAELRSSEMFVRRSLMLLHGHTEGLYCDDGEMQCNLLGCNTDFKRDGMARLIEKTTIAVQTLVAELRRERDEARGALDFACRDGSQFQDERDSLRQRVKELEEQAGILTVMHTPDCGSKTALVQEIQRADRLAERVKELEEQRDEQMRRAMGMERACGLSVARAEVLGKLRGEHYEFTLYPTRSLCHCGKPWPYPDRQMIDEVLPPKGEEPAR